MSIDFTRDAYRKYGTKKVISRMIYSLENLKDTWTNEKFELVTA
jgi:hypothetical protein